MPRLCFALDLKDDPKVLDAYKKWYAPGGSPAAITRSQQPLPWAAPGRKWVPSELIYDLRQQ